MTKTIYLTNAFSLNMVDLSTSEEVLVRVMPVTLEYVRDIVYGVGGEHNCISAIGHESTANMLSKLFDLPIHTNRMSVSLDTNTSVIVAQYTGPRLEEGVTILPEGAEIRFFHITI